MPKSCRLAASFGLMPALPGAARANIVVNGAFEAVLSGWSNNWSSENAIVYSGFKSVASGCQNPACVNPSSPARPFLSQDLPTVAGDAYTLDLFVNKAGTTPNALRKSWGGALVVTSADTPDGLGCVEHGAGNLSAVSATTSLTVLGRNNHDTVYLDDGFVMQPTEAGAGRAGVGRFRGASPAQRTPAGVREMRPLMAGLRAVGTAAVLAMAGCVGPPINPPFWAGQSVGQLRRTFPVGQTRPEDVTARIVEARSSVGGTGVLDARRVFFQRDQRGVLVSGQPGQSGQQPEAPLVPVSRVSYFWSETNYPSDRTGYDRDLRFYFDGDSKLVYLERLDRDARSRPFKLCC